jgi:four helix bundle protein
MDYRHLVAWQRAMELAEAVYAHTTAFPPDERYGLTAQLRRAAVSVPSNIAEGQGRHSSDDEFARFLSMAHGSLCELATQIELALRLKYLPPERAEALRPILEETGRVLNGLLKSKRPRRRY